MRRATFLLLFLTAGCSWSNSLYHARRLSESALRAEREERAFDATSFWGQVAVKADSSLARDPTGPHASEALWLRGRALARLGDCDGAMPLLERASIAAGDADWRDDLRLETARCRATAAGGDVTRALADLEPLLTSPDDPLREQARALGGRILMRAERWQAARELLADDESVEGRWLHAVALARLGQAEAALAAVEDRAAVGDSLANWVDLFRALASVPGGNNGTALRARLGEHRWVTDTVRLRWDLAAAEAMMSRDSVAAMRLLNQLADGPVTPETFRARMLVADHVMAAARDDVTLAAALDRIDALGRTDPTIVLLAQRLTSWGSAIRADVDTIAPGTPDGDMAMFFHSEVARDTLHAPALSAWLLARLESGWPASPYVAKALLARLVLEPDSIEALRSRLEAHAGSPYLAYVRGREDARFAELEDALGFYLADRFGATLTRGEQ